MAVLKKSSSAEPAKRSPKRHLKADALNVDYELIGDVVDPTTATSLSLAFAAVNKFPELVKRHRRFVGGATATAVVSTTAIILAYRAMHSRMSKGESATDALKGITEDEIERAASLLKRIRINK